MNIEEIFFSALDKTNEEERNAYLEEVFLSRPEIRDDVLELLRSHQNAGSFLGKPLVDSHALTDDRNLVDQYVGSRMGPYQIVKRIGQGGMGLVYLAEQTLPVHRQVAIKILKPELATSSVLARFEAERQAIAMMDHPNIAKILEAGQTASGQPYFVMELVHGMPITKYCDQAQLNTHQRLGLMIQVCKAIQHAHQKGIIHRDIKPANVLVANYDGQPVPKVIDFGIAKALDMRLTDQSVHTDLGAIIGTLEYMSPEQAGLEKTEVDTRSDIYSLGVLLYELLTGSTPIDRTTLHTISLVEMLRSIREVDAPRPSTRIGSAEYAPSNAARRSTETSRLQGLVRGDLDWIAMKALDKDRSRRYQTANDLAMELERFLAHEPVMAGPPSAIYKLRKFIRRNRVASISVAGVLLSIIVGAGVATWGWIEARQQQAATLLAQDREREAKNTAEFRLQQVELGMETLVSIFDDLNPDRQGEGGTDLRGPLTKRLEAASKRMETERMGDPLKVARMQYRLGTALRELGSPNAALDVFQRASAAFEKESESDPKEKLNSDDQLAMCLKSLGKFDAALELQQKNLVEKKRLLGVADTDTLACAQNVAVILSSMGRTKEAIQTMEETDRLIRENFGADDPTALTVRANLANMVFEAGDVTKSIQIMEDVVQKRRQLQGSKHLDTAFALMVLAKTYMQGGREADSLPLVEESYRIENEILGPDHPRTISAAANLGTAWQRLGKVNEGIALLEQVLTHRRIHIGADHPDTLTTMSTLSSAYRKAKKLDKALKISQEAMDARIRLLGSKHPSTMVSRNNHANILKDMNEIEKAIPIYEELLAERIAVLGPEHVETLITMNNLALSYEQAGQLEKAEKMMLDGLQLKERTMGRHHSSILSGISNLAILYRRQNQMEKAIKLFEDILQRASERPQGLPNTMEDLPENMINFYSEAKRPLDSEIQARKLLTEYAVKYGPNATETLRIKAALGRLMIELQRPDEGEKIIRECLDQRLEHEPDIWTTAYTQSLLGQFLLRRKSFAEAERLLLEGYQGMMSRTTKIPSSQRDRRLKEARGWLEQLYIETDRPDEATKLSGAK